MAPTSPESQTLLTAALLVAAAGARARARPMPPPALSRFRAWCQTCPCSAVVPSESSPLTLACRPACHPQEVPMLLLLCILRLSSPTSSVPTMCPLGCPAPEVCRIVRVRFRTAEASGLTCLALGRCAQPSSLHVPRRRCLCRVRRASKRRRSALPIHPCCTTNSAARTRAQTANPAAPPVDLPAQPPDERPAR